MADIIKHRGIVDRVDGSHVVVRIVQTSACSSCSAKGLCNASESKEKWIDVYEVNASYRVGEEVVVCGRCVAFSSSGSVGCYTLLYSNLLHEGQVE